MRYLFSYFSEISILRTGQDPDFQKRTGGGRLAQQDIIGGRDATPPKPWVLTRAEYSARCMPPMPEWTDSFGVVEGK